jgi:hypothetical protein
MNGARMTVLCHGTTLAKLARALSNQIHLLQNRSRRGPRLHSYFGASEVGGATSGATLLPSRVRLNAGRSSFMAFW